MNLRDFATPLTIVSTIPLCATGAALLLGVRGGVVDPVHEVSSVLFLAGTAFHLFLHRKALLAHLRRPSSKWAAVVSTVLSLLVVASAMDGSRTPSPHIQARRSLELVLDADLADLALLTDRTEAELRGVLREAGIEHVEANTSLEELARKNDRSPLELVGLVIPEAPPR
ncbi:MAG TPA: hypothetical protein PKO15_04750 [Fibrobacteria bacterium]|nr:hypothetical protein [Fibrobacteria bacterium]HOX50739.1 hypothetical protein [Fibrobacteria bacterium]